MLVFQFFCASRRSVDRSVSATRWSQWARNYTATRSRRDNNMHGNAQSHSLVLKHPPLVATGWTSFSVVATQPTLFQPFRRPVRNTTRAAQLIAALRDGDDRFVDVELGRYDQAMQGDFHQVPMSLERYLSWLQSDRQTGQVDGKQLYLAQWRDWSEIKAVRNTAVPPPVLSELIDKDQVDLYQSALFLGPTGAITSLHYDPYINLFHLQASAAPELYAKHVILLPPEASAILRNIGPPHPQHNTSTCEFRIARTTSNDHSVFRVEVVNHGTPHEMELIQDHAMHCILREGETLLIPRGWWHRVENICLVDGRDEGVGWTAGVSWWFLSRTLSH